MDTPDDCRRMDHEARFGSWPECDTCGAELPYLGRHRYGACPLCPAEPEDDEDA
jgi:hypothetical protein